MKKIAAALLLVAFVGGGAWLFAKRKGNLAKADVAPVLPVVVDSVLLVRAPLSLTLPAMGVVASGSSTTLSTKVSGRVLQVFKQEGEKVQAGDKLAVIDGSELQAKKEGLHLQRQGIDYQLAAKEGERAAIRSALSAARETHGRSMELLRVKGFSIEQFRQEETGIAQLEAQLTSADNGLEVLKKNKEVLGQGIAEVEALFSYTTITAPIAGTISERMIKSGDLSAPGKPLFSIAAASGLYLSLSLPDSVTAREIRYQTHHLTLAPRNQAGATGLVQYVAPLPDGTNLVEGQFVNIQIVVLSGEEVVVPPDGLLSMDDRTWVFVLENGMARMTPVQVKARGLEGVVVAEDLAGRRILTAKPDILLRVAGGAPLLSLAKP